MIYHRAGRLAKTKMNNGELLARKEVEADGLGRRHLGHQGALTIPTARALPVLDGTQ